ncbi:hypothetical protein F4777DRAFT_542162 [Nemania sp. FL0916]|nr:hypothetical protein F4777DRAFT_542162 [Nemania sp. FL0916]
MAEEVERLVLAQFREIVEKGKTAIENVESAGDEAPAPMLKAAQNLVKEGEKALKKIEPVSTAHHEEYGTNFINALKENEDIAQPLREIEDLLWDFDDYVEVDKFDAEKFSELQKASRNAALKTFDTLKRMKLVAPAPALISPPASEVGGSMSITTNPRPASTERLNIQLDGRGSGSVSAEPGVDAAGPWSTTDGPRSPQPNIEFDPANARFSGQSDPPSGPPPSPPSTNPWDVGIAVTSIMGHPREGDDLRRRPPVTPDSPTIPQTQLISRGENALGVIRSREALEGNTGIANANDEHEQRRHAMSQSHAPTSEGSRSPLQSHRWTGSTQGSTDSARSPTQSYSGFARGSDTVIAEHLQNHELGGAPTGAGPPPRIPRRSINRHVVSAQIGGQDNNHLAIHDLPPRTTSVANQSSSSYILSSRRPSTESINSSVFDIVDSIPTDPGASSEPRSAARSPTAASARPRHYAPFPPPSYPGPPPMYQIPSIPHRPGSGITTRSMSSSGPTLHPGINLDEGGGLIPVHTLDSAHDEMIIPPREPDCSITPSSSFYKLKRFCKGAEEAQRGLLGFKKIKRPVGGFSSTTVAKCTHCLFELDFKSVEQDVNNESSGTFTSNEVNFRLRALQKSHLPIRVIDEQMYACIFCIETGHTLEESDATVFFNQKQLFAHMTRHPRPLPKVAGFTIIEDATRPPALSDNFDLHFPHAPAVSVMVGLAREVARLPAAVATDTRKLTHGTMRLPPDRQPVLHFAVGARIVGIEFPPRYDGKWAIGWHDGVRAAFETDAVMLEAPPNTEVKMQSNSSVQAVARWKWNQKGDSRWLKFDKGDVIKNISWVYTDHWCWSGSTSRGSGVFPQSHLDPGSVRLNDGGDADSVASWEKKNPLNFSFRRRDDRRIGSLSSH